MVHPQYIELRNQALAYQSDQTNSQSHTIKLCLADWHRDNGIVTLVLVDDGSVSLYFSNGSSILGCGKYASVQQSAGELMQEAEQFLQEAYEVDQAELPNTGEIQFYFKHNSVLSRLSGGNNPAMAPASVIRLFEVMNGVIADIREASEGKN
jgi:hypothetical protein